MAYQVVLAGDAQASESGGVIVVTYQGMNNGDAETGGTWDKATVTDENGGHVADSSNQVHSVEAGASYEGKIEQMQPVHAGTYNVSLVLDAENSQDSSWSGQVTVEG